MVKFVQKLLRRTIMSFLAYSSWQVIHLHTYQLCYIIFVITTTFLTCGIFL